MITEEGAAYLEGEFDASTVSADEERVQDNCPLRWAGPLERVSVFPFCFGAVETVLHAILACRK